MGSSTGLSGRGMRRQLGNLQVTSDKQETQSKTLSGATWEAISLLTNMAMTAKLGKKTRLKVDAFMNFSDKKFKPVLWNILAQRDRSTQTARVQDGGIQDLGSAGSWGWQMHSDQRLGINEQHLDRDVIDLTSNMDRARTGARTHGNDLRVVQEGDDVVLPSQESMNNGSSLFDYGLDNPYNDLIDDFDPYLEYGKGYQNKTAFEDDFYR